MARLYVVLLPVVIGYAAGCSTSYWYQEGKTFDECYEDHRACYKELAELTTQTEFGDRELKIIDDCMKSKGYRLKAESHLPYPTKTLKPDRTIHYRLHGIAGRPSKK
ncbi:MAG: hypothetical protein JSW27_10125 [Phycisphaerales bacterium]|nr:MAG: hypothetical protein JSW27_10125 [Phycisphaerales bacterium]